MTHFELKLERHLHAETARMTKKYEKKKLAEIRYLQKRHAPGYFKHEKDAAKPEPREFKHVEDAERLAKDISVLLFGEAPTEEDKFWGLHHKRTADLRFNLRAMHLAYGFLRGVPYSRIENTTHNDLRFFEKKDEGTENEPDSIHGFLRQVWHIARRYSEIDIRDLRQKWSTWVDECRKHVENQAAKVNSEPEQVATS